MLRFFFGAHAFSSTSVIRLNFEGAESEKTQMMYQLLNSEGAEADKLNGF
jgi:hypothetical protein